VPLIVIQRQLGHSCRASTTPRSSRQSTPAADQ
jgi:hypothetical protein